MRLTRVWRSALCVFGFAGVVNGAPVAAQSHVVVDTVPAPSLRANLYGDPAERLTSVYLPPGYSASATKRYPVIYLLHGFGGGAEPFLRRIAFGKPLDSLIARGALTEMIVVTPDASNRLTGGFFRNSPVTGKWEDFVVKDLVSFIDRKYRTIPSRKARGIAGWSMGGYGALYIAARNPRTFSAVYALSACCLPADLPSEPLWRVRGREAARAEASGNFATGFNTSIVTALAAIYTPNVSKAPLFVNFPWSGDSATVIDSTAGLWRDTPLEIIRRSSPQKLRGTRWAFDAGDRDAFPDIPLAASELHRILTDKGVPHTFEIFRGTHGDRIRERVETRMLPFFSRALKQ
ncbi:MAG: alpha/beta fold hydrolase [Gemmatimonadaceae bacterium]|nr:alpha/beta fold hydrolase [Gemmatimonadaceae bacterium]